MKTAYLIQQMAIASYPIRNYIRTNEERVRRENHIAPEHTRRVGSFLMDIESTNYLGERQDPLRIAEEKRTALAAALALENEPAEHKKHRLTIYAEQKKKEAQRKRGKRVLKI